MATIHKPAADKKLILAIYILGLAWLGWLWYTSRLDEVTRFLSAAGPYAYLIYVLAYLILGLLMLPINWLNIIAGVIFGPIIGTLLILLGVAVASSAAFFITRYFLDPEWVLHKIPSQAQFLKKAIHQDHAWKTIIILRLSNLIPFAVLNYVSSGMQIQYSGYLTATLIGSTPGALVYSGLGALLARLIQQR